MRNNYDTDGKLSNVVCTLPLTSVQKLNGTVTNLSDRRCSVPLRNGSFKELVFTVGNNTTQRSDMKVLLEVEVSG